MTIPSFIRGKITAVRMLHHQLFEGNIKIRGIKPTKNLIIIKSRTTSNIKENIFSCFIIYQWEIKHWNRGGSSTWRVKRSEYLAVVFHSRRQCWGRSKTRWGRKYVVVDSFAGVGEGLLGEHVWVLRMCEVFHENEERF